MNSERESSRAERMTAEKENERTNFDGMNRSIGRWMSRSSLHWTGETIEGPTLKGIKHGWPMEEVGRVVRNLRR